MFLRLVALRNRSLRVVIVFCYRWGDLARSFSSVVRTECILSVGAADSVERMSFMAAAAASYYSY